MTNKTLADRLELLHTQVSLNHNENRDCRYSVWREVDDVYQKHAQAAILADLMGLLPKPYDFKSDREMLMSKVSDDLKSKIQEAELNAMLIGGVTAHNLAIDQVTNLIKQYAGGKKS